MDESFQVIARFRARPGREAELRAVLTALIEPTRREAGCIRYELWANQQDPAELTFVEEWEDLEALADHLESAHVQAARSSYPDLIEGDLDLRKYDVVA